MDKNTVFANSLYRNKNIAEKLKPEGLTFKAGSHSTAVNVHVYLTIEGETPLLVWYKTVWCSNSYEFNEQKKTIGLQSGCGFYKNALLKFFVDVAHCEALEMVESYKSKEDSEAVRRERESQKIEKYKQAYAY